eukprot:m.219322 g.219322  ORF g.219322 m.219322 type:complete len:111 (+) comp26283_c1_seq5:989-1321(+)
MRKYTSNNQQNAPIRFVFQPPRSPDFNVNDLGFYRSLEADVWKTISHDASEQKLANTVCTCFKKYDTKKLTKIFNTKHAIMKAVKDVEGRINYVKPHDVSDIWVEYDDII